MKILLIVTGSISAYKAPSIANGLRATGHEVTVVLTKSALKFITKLSFSSQGFETYTDEDDWNADRVLHIDLQKWAEKVLIAPCTANTLAKMSNGFADNLASNTLRAMPSNKTLYVALAMNTEMYENSVTREHQYEIERRTTAIFIKPQIKMLACGDEGIGALASTREIVQVVNKG